MGIVLCWWLLCSVFPSCCSYFFSVDLLASLLYKWSVEIYLYVVGFSVDLFCRFKKNESKADVLFLYFPPHRLQHQIRSVITNCLTRMLNMSPLLSTWTDWWWFHTKACWGFCAAQFAWNSSASCKIFHSFQPNDLFSFNCIPQGVNCWRPVGEHS